MRSVLAQVHLVCLDFFCLPPLTTAPLPFSVTIARWMTDMIVIPFLLCSLPRGGAGVPCC